MRNLDPVDIDGILSSRLFCRGRKWTSTVSLKKSKPLSTGTERRKTGEERVLLNCKVERSGWTDNVKGWCEEREEIRYFLFSKTPTTGHRDYE